MRTETAVKTVRRSFALPGRLVREAAAAGPPELRGNLNRLVTVALQEYVARLRQRDFESAMARMAADPTVRRENARIAKAFRKAEGDGL
jgi:hypothetical protein